MHEQQTMQQTNINQTINEKSFDKFWKDAPTKQYGHTPILYDHKSIYKSLVL
jgi:hypothetical protein